MMLYISGIERFSTMASSSDSVGDRVLGYEATFNPPLERKYMCPICLAALREAVQTTCGHRFCNNCVYRVASGESFMRCPVDNKWLSTVSEIFPDVATRREVLSLFVQCENTQLVCYWTGELRELESHVTRCTFILTPCTNECGEMVNKDHMREHLEECTRRLVICQHCQTQVVYSDVTKHQVLICKKFPVKCTLCGKIGINREDIPKHVDSVMGDCPQSLVTCKYSKMGCTVKDARQKLPLHYKDQADFHINLCMTRVCQYEQRFTDMEQKLSQVLDRLQDFKNSRVPELLNFQQSQTHSIRSSGQIYWLFDLTGGHSRPLKSPVIYTGSPGYKMSVRLVMDDDTESGVTYTCLHVQLQEGEFDDVLSFPLSGLCTVTLLDISDEFSLTSYINHTTAFMFEGLQRCSGNETSIYRNRFLPRDDLFKWCYESRLYFRVTFSV